ncbi:glycosyltransferase family 4 protein, partial [Paenibacillus odorifer]
VKKQLPHIPVFLFLHSLTFTPGTDKVAHALAKADLIIANSHSLQRRLDRRFPQLTTGIHIVLLGADLDRFTPVQTSEKQQLRSFYRLPQTFTVLFVGRVIPRKGVVTFLGNVAHENIHTLYQAADCFVCPSQNHESFGLVNVEAMASGLPVIASNNGGIREIVASGHNGYLVERYREPLPFARYLLRIARHPQLAVTIGSQGRADALEA